MDGLTPPNNPVFLKPLESSLLETLWKKVKMLVTSIISFFPCFLSSKKANLTFLGRIKVFSANSLSLDQPKILSFDKRYRRVISKNFFFQQAMECETNVTDMYVSSVVIRLHPLSARAAKKLTDMLNQPDGLKQWLTKLLNDDQLDKLKQAGWNSISIEVNLLSPADKSGV